MDNETIISALGKTKDLNILYTYPATYQEQFELLGKFYNLEKVDESIKKYKALFTSKKRLIANTIKYVNMESRKRI